MLAYLFVAIAIAVHMRFFALPFSFTPVAAALLYFGWKLGGRALLVLISGTISWEVQIFTRPTAALDLATARSESALGGLHVVPLPNGLALAGTF